jgi:hypothetical protein
MEAWDKKGRLWKTFPYIYDFAPRDFPNAKGWYPMWQTGICWDLQAKHVSAAIRGEYYSTNDPSVTARMFEPSELRKIMH